MTIKPPGARVKDDDLLLRAHQPTIQQEPKPGEAGTSLGREIDPFLGSSIRSPLCQILVAHGDCGSGAFAEGAKDEAVSQWPRNA